MHAILFDIDGTLLESTEVDARLYEEAVRTVLGDIGLRPQWNDYVHVTDSGLLREILADNGIAHSVELEGRVRATFVALIDAYISPRYALPLDQARIDASPLTRYAGDLVIYFLQGDLATEEAQRRYADVMRFLRDVQTGRASLGADDPVAQPVGQIVARTMEPSALIPQFTVWRDVDLSAANAKRNGLSWNTLLLRSYARALREVPELLSRWEDGGPVDSGPPAVAVAVATDRGLLVPVISEPDVRPTVELDAELKQVFAEAQRGKVSPSHLAPANGSLSSLGSLGVDRFQALITPPQASVLSVGTIKQRPVAVPGGVGLALTVTLGLTIDHRVADGSHAALLLEAIVRDLGGAPL